VAGKIADGKALHHQDDGVIFLVVETRHQRCAIPVNQAFPAARYSCGEIRNSPMIWEIAKKRGAGWGAAIFSENSAIHSAGATTAAGGGARGARLSCHMREPVMPNKSGRNPETKTSTVQIGPKP
jgi:hypothetical protein